VTPFQTYSADIRHLLTAAGEAVGLADPVAVQLGDAVNPLLKTAIRGPVTPLDGVLMRSWDRTFKQTTPGVLVGVRPYTVGAIKFARVTAEPGMFDRSGSGYDFFAVGRADYAALYRAAQRASREVNPQGPPPVVAPETLAALRRNTHDFLQADRLRQLVSLGGRPKRGLLLTGPPGNGKTSACRWVWERCKTLGLEYRLVSPDDYRAARGGCNPAESVRQLFAVETAGVVFFDDLDLALRDRSTSDDPEDQAVFLGALDGIRPTAGAVYVFTTNLPPERIDPAFLRPGRIDVVLHFPKPEAGLRRELVERWNPEVRADLDMRRVLADTDGFSFAEVEELKNLLILGHLETGGWDWGWAVDQFRNTRDGLPSKPRVGFVAANGRG
jgi:hypothetical protein